MHLAVKFEQTQSSIYAERLTVSLQKRQMSQGFKFRKVEREVKYGILFAKKKVTRKYFLSI
jgi:hypothetical protein